MDSPSDAGARADVVAPMDTGGPMDASPLADVSPPMDRALVDGSVPADVPGSALDASSETGVGMDAGQDVARVDGSLADVLADRTPATDSASPLADGAVDVATPPARCAPAVDGTLGAGEYAAAVTVNNTVLPSAWGPNELRSLSACFDDSTLYLALRGSVEGGLPGGTANSIVLYVDRDFRGGPGGTATGISLFSALTDRSGRLDSALSAAFRPTAMVDGFGVEAAFGVWGTRAFTAMASDETQGWRLFWPAGGMPDRRSDFAYVNAGVTTACQDRPGTMDDVCETAIRWTSLFEGARPALTTIALFARIVNSDGSMSPDQTLPQDDPSSPRSVSRVLTLEVR